jgi:hypothetical protein
MGPVIRSHWAIENSLHWVMDMIFRDDECRIRTEHAPANFTTLKHMAHNLIRRAPGKDSFRRKRKVAAWDDEFLASSAYPSASVGPGIRNRSKFPGGWGSQRFENVIQAGDDNWHP